MCFDIYTPFKAVFVVYVHLAGFRMIYNWIVQDPTLYLEGLRLILCMYHVRHRDHDLPQPRLWDIFHFYSHIYRWLQVSAYKMMRLRGELPSTRPYALHRFIWLCTRSRHSHYSRYLSMHLSLSLYEAYFEARAGYLRQHVNDNCFPQSGISIPYWWVGGPCPHTYAGKRYG